jgi:hypothetical protein
MTATLNTEWSWLESTSGATPEVDSNLGCTANVDQWALRTPRLVMLGYGLLIHSSTVSSSQGTIAAATVASATNKPTAPLAMPSLRFQLLIAGW